jgi:hypothetical protein
MNKQKQIGMVVESAPNNISVEISSKNEFEKNKVDLQIGKYLKIADGNGKFVIANIKNLKAVHKIDKNENIDFIFQISSQPVGVLDEDLNNFERGNVTLPVPMEPVYIVDDKAIEIIFASNEEYKVSFGKLVQNKDVELKINGDKFFSKHVAVIGSTGSGKSCTVAKILQKSVGICDSENINCGNIKNSHIVIFDIHSEYSSAFDLSEEQKFNLNILNVSNMILPYWLMNAEELESMFIESNENNSHNQISQFRRAVILNKEKYNPTIKEVTYDTPIYFNIQEVCNYIDNLNNEVIGKLEGENLPKLEDGTLVENRAEYYFDKVNEFVPTSRSKASKASNGPFNGEFDRFILRLRTKVADKRLKFLLAPINEDGTPYKTDDFNQILKQFLGYLNKSNVTIIDLSGIPFEVLNITVSLISRLIFDFCFYYSKLQHDNDLLNDIPVMIVCEEAHNYVPRTGGVEYRSSKESLERIAKEGRKYGLGLMVVSQRPSEISETIFAQCNNFISLRLTNNNDQNYVKKLMPDTTSGIADILPNLSPGEFIIVGDSVLMPSVAKIEMPSPEPQSQSVDFYTEWQEDWRDISFDEVIYKWRKEW